MASHLRADLIEMVSANWADRNRAVDRIAERIEALERKVKVLEQRTGDHSQPKDEGVAPG